MPSANKSVKQQLRDYLAANQPAAITEAVWQDLLLRLAPVSESYLRDLLRDTGLPFDQPYAGIRQHTFEELEQSLRDMLQVYSESLAGRRARPRALLPPPGDRRQGSRQIPGRHPAQHAGKTHAKRRDGPVDAGLAGKSRSLPRLGETRNAERMTRLSRSSRPFSLVFLKLNRYPKIALISRWSVAWVTPTPTPKLNSQFFPKSISTAGRTSAAADRAPGPSP